MKQRVNIDNDNPYQVKQQLTKGQQLYPVVFEPLKHIKLSRSTFRVTTFVEFAPYIKSFDNFMDYLQQFIDDIRDPEHLIRLGGTVGVMFDKRMADLNRPIEEIKRSCERSFSPQGGEGLNPRIDKGTCDPESPTSTCVIKYKEVCQVAAQYKAILESARYIKRAYIQIRDQFFSSINHLDTLREEPDSEIRNKRNVEREENLQSINARLTSNEVKSLNQVINKIKKTLPATYPQPRRTKRFTFGTLILGWGIWSNRKQIKKLKTNIDKLYAQNKLQDKQIHDVANYLNLTATRVIQHDKMLYNVQMKLTRVQYILKTVTQFISFRVHLVDMLLDANVILNRLLTGLMVLRNNVEDIYKYLRVMSTRKVDPVMIPPPALRDLLETVKQEMASNPRLKLPYDPQYEIFDFYPMMRITPLVTHNSLTMLLTIPLIDKSLELNIYKIHNMPAVDPLTKLAAIYQLEGQYLAVDQHGVYIAHPDPEEVQICFATRGGLCMMNQALHPVEKANWCTYALFIQDDDRVKRDCVLDFKHRTSSLAQNIDGYLWAISSLAGERIQIRCLEETHIEQLKPPLQLVYIGNGCEGYSPSIKIPAKNELTSQIDLPERTNFFLEISKKYTKIGRVGPWDYFKIDKMTEKELEKTVEMLPALPPMNYDNLNKKLGELESYPTEMPLAILAIFLGLTALSLLATIAGFVWYIWKMRGKLKDVYSVVNLLTGKTTGPKANSMKTSILSLLGIPVHHLRPLPTVPVARAATPTDSDDSACDQEFELKPISRVSTPVPKTLSDTIKEVLPTPTQRVRYAKYLDKKRSDNQDSVSISETSL